MELGQRLGPPAPSIRNRVGKARDACKRVALRRRALGRAAFTCSCMPILLGSVSEARSMCYWIVRWNQVGSRAKADLAFGPVADEL